MLSQISQTELEQKLKVFRARALSLQGVTAAGKPLGAEVAAFFGDLIKNSTDPEHIKKRNEFLSRAEKDPATRDQLCSLRIENFNNYVLADTNFMNMFFEVVNLNPDERPAHQNSAMQETKLHEVGPDGESRIVKVNREDTEALINLKWLSSDTVRYRLVDIYRGSIVDAALATINMAGDMSNQMDGLCQSLLLASAFGAFKFTGKKSTWTFVPNSRVKLANLPSTNVVNVYTTGTTYVGKFGFPVLDEIVDYASRMGSSYPGGFTATGRILLPPPHIKSIASGITPTGAKPTQLAEELLDAGWFGINYLGKNWTFVPDNTLDPAKHTCYPEFSRKPGRVFLKPALDREEVVSNTELRKRNEEERYMVKPFGAYINETSRPLVASFKYKADD